MARMTMAVLAASLAKTNETLAMLGDSIKALIEQPVPVEGPKLVVGQQGPVSIPQFRIQGGTFYATANRTLANGKRITGYISWSDSRRLSGGEAGRGGLPSSKGNHVPFIRAFADEASARGFDDLAEDLTKYAEHRGV